MVFLFRPLSLMATNPHWAWSTVAMKTYWSLMAWSWSSRRGGGGGRRLEHDEGWRLGGFGLEWPTVFLFAPSTGATQIAPMLGGAGNSCRHNGRWWYLCLRTPKKGKIGVLRIQSMCGPFGHRRHHGRHRLAVVRWSSVAVEQATVVLERGTVALPPQSSSVSSRREGRNLNGFWVLARNPQSFLSYNGSFCI